MERSLTPVDVVPLLFGNVTGLRMEWAASSAYHYSGDGTAEPWQVVFDLSPVIVQRMRDGDDDTLRMVFANLERLLPPSNWAARNLLVVGFIEGVQNQSMHGGGRGPDGFLPFLGPLSRDAWEAVDAFWRGDGSRLDFIHSDDWPTPT